MPSEQPSSPSSPTSSSLGVPASLKSPTSKLVRWSTIRDYEEYRNWVCLNETGTLKDALIKLGWKYHIITEEDLAVAELYDRFSQDCPFVDSWTAFWAGNLQYPSDKSGPFLVSAFKNANDAMLFKLMLDQ